MKSIFIILFCFASANASSDPDGTTDVILTVSFKATSDNLIVQFDASSGSDIDGTIISYAWAFGDGHTAKVSESTCYHEYPTGGIYQVSLIVTNKYGEAYTTTQTIEVNALSKESLDTSEDVVKQKVWLPSNFRGTANTLEDSPETSPEDLDKKWLPANFKTADPTEECPETIEDWDNLKKWLPMNFRAAYPTLLYQGTIDGMNAESYHKACDNAGPTITIAKIHWRIEKQDIPCSLIGGFMDKSWTSSQEPIVSDQAFIFSLTTAMKRGILEGDVSNAGSNDATMGPIFGKNDLVIAFDGNSFSKQEFYERNIFQDGMTKSQYYFDLYELEVYGLSYDSIN